MSSRNYRHGGRIVVGITSRSSERDLKWLMDFIKTAFYDYVSYVTYLPISNTNRVEWERNVSACSHVILYHTKRQGRINITDVEGALYDEELQTLSTTLGRSNVLVVLDDLENCSDTEKQRILGSQPSLERLSANLLLFPEITKYEEAMKKKEEFIQLLGIRAAARDPQPNTTKAKDISSYSLPGVFSWLSLDKISNKISEYKPKLPSFDIAPVLTQSRLKIGIFSRSAESNYDWLVEWLKTTYLTRPVDVRAVCISNTTSHFYTELSHCSFAILYHTKKQGRINITDVTDNLYDEELQDLSKILGKENVIVVIDDLQKTDSSEKDRILRNQPSIGRLAGALLLFKEKKKSSENLEEIEQILRKKIPSNEVRGADYRQDNAGRKDKPSSTHPRFPDVVNSQHSSVDIDPKHPRNRYTERRGQPEKSTAHEYTRKGADDSGGPDPKRRNVDVIGPTSAEVESAFQEANYHFMLSYEANNAAFTKWLECQQIQEKQARDMKEQIERQQRENEELQQKNSDLEMKMRESIESSNKTLREKEEQERTINQLRESHTKTLREMEEKERTIDRLRQDVRDKDKIIAENQETVWKMEDTIKELKKTLSEKEELEIRSRNQTEDTMEKLHQDLRDKDKTIEEDKEKMRKMEEKIQHLLNTNHRVETNPRPEQAGQNPTQEMQSHETQPYNARSPLPGQEADKMRSNQDMEKCEWKEEGPPQVRPQRNTATLYDPGQKSTKTQSLREAEELIEELRRTIQQKEEKIQKMTAQLKENEKLIQDILMLQRGEKKTKS